MALLLLPAIGYAPLIPGRSAVALVGSALVLAVHCTCCLMASKVCAASTWATRVAFVPVACCLGRGVTLLGGVHQAFQQATTANKYNTYPHTDIYATFLSFMPILLLLCYISWICCAVRH